jgi:hypothetical protein
VVSLHLSPTDTLYLVGRYGSALAELILAITPCSAGWCVRKSYRQVDPLGFRPGRAHILQAQLKPQHLGSENCRIRDTLRSAPLFPIPDQLSRAHPRQSAQNAFSCWFYPTHAKNHIVVGQSRTGYLRRQCKVYQHAYKVKL